ncbi:phage terminase small subunit [Asticcacaulis sp. BYS171W]|uniref:Phage terminase small subunit n=1 Tax=Asticcacaulis aquaticus TaxID=2984212 RepID=A0ABT5HT91_9CAUL|nr:phage terminase small subunit [Asticcacaulis aquaticus]MDC7683282.1 phage terminase small subunit [Asticcacaulis aquaticus]
MKKRLSPCQIHVAMHLAKTAIDAAPVLTVAAARPVEPDTSPYALLRAQLGEHLRELSDTASIEARQEKKREWMPIYADHVDTVILTSEETDKALQDDIVSWMAVWAFDIATIDPEFYPRAFELADYILKFGLTVPDRFNRAPAALFAEFVADDGQNKLGSAPADGPAPFSIDTVRRALGLIEGRTDAVDIIPAKLHKLAGKLFVRLAAAIDAGTEQGPAGGAKAARTQALKHFHRAYQLDNKIGVKKDIETIERVLKKTPE